MINRDGVDYIYNPNNIAPTYKRGVGTSSTLLHTIQVLDMRRSFIADVRI